MASIVNGGEFVNYRLACRVCGSHSIGERWDDPAIDNLPYYMCNCCGERNVKMPRNQSFTDLVRIASLFAIPFMSEEGTINPEEVLAMSNQPDSDAGVAQSAEHLSRKQEIEGSIPSASSKGFSDAQRAIVAKIVHNRVAHQDNLNTASEAQATLKKLETEYKAAKEAQEFRVQSGTRQAKFHLDQLVQAENELRIALAEDLIVAAKDILGPVEVKPAESEEHEDLGRAE